MIAAAEISSDVWRGLGTFTTVKPADNLEQSTQMLKDAGVHFTSYNDGIHLKVQAGSVTVDFWPSTGLWLVPGCGQFKRRGVDRLIAFVQKQVTA